VHWPLVLPRRPEIQVLPVSMTAGYVGLAVLIQCPGSPLSWFLNLI